VSATSGTIFRLENAAPEKSVANVDYFKQRLLTFFGDVDRQLEGRDFIAGEISVADLMLYPNYAARRALIDAAPGFANLHRWAASMAARPGVAKGMNP
jgi:GST-like protein